MLRIEHPPFLDEGGLDDARERPDFGFMSLHAAIGEFDVYPRVFDPRVDEPPIRANLSSDLGDVYAEAAWIQGLIAKNGVTPFVAWQIRDAYRTHWHWRAVPALAYLGWLNPGR